MAADFSEILRVFKHEDIARRYFIMNSFDGTLTILGIIVALYLSGVEDARVVIVSCVGAAVAMGVSGFWGAYAAEYAERQRKFKDLERHMMKKLKGTGIERKMKLHTIVLALIDGLSPAMASAIILTPFITLGYAGHSINEAYTLSIGIVASILLGLGALVGSIARENIASNAVKMLSAGVIVAAISIALESLKVI